MFSVVRKGQAMLRHNQWCPPTKREPHLSMILRKWIWNKVCSTIFGAHTDPTDLCCLCMCELQEFEPLQHPALFKSFVVQLEAADADKWIQASPSPMYAVVNQRRMWGEEAWMFLSFALSFDCALNRRDKRRISCWFSVEPVIMVQKGTPVCLSVLSLLSFHDTY